MKRLLTLKAAIAKTASSGLSGEFRTPEPAAEIPDFQIEINRRYKLSVVNKLYTFPKLAEEEAVENSGADRSIMHLRDIGKYNLF